MTFDATIVIVTRNRKDELRQAVSSALAQEGAIEVIVVDDGSQDHTEEMMRSEFPGATFIRDSVSRGYIAQRNRAARLASAPIIVSIDDDAAFASPSTVKQTLAEFDSPRVGAVAIPFINVRQDARVRQRAPEGGGCHPVASFVGTAYAVRRDVFLATGGFREFYFHQGEEEDLCLRLYASGFVTRLGSADPIHHFQSPRRDFERMDLYGRRNNVLFAWLNVPMPYLLPHLAGTSIKGLLHGVKCRRPLRMLRGLAMGYRACLEPQAVRQPVPAEIYRQWRHLRRR